MTSAVDRNTSLWGWVTGLLLGLWDKHCNVFHCTFATKSQFSAKHKSRIVGILAERTARYRGLIRVTVWKFFLEELRNG